MKSKASFIVLGLPVKQVHQVLITSPRCAGHCHCMENSTDHHHVTRQEQKSKCPPTASWAAISTICLSETDETEQSTSEATLSLTDGKE